MVTVELVGEEQWARVAAVRLAALRDAPEAFGSSLEREQGFQERHWRMRLRGSPTWLASVEGRDVGLVTVIEEPGAQPHERHVVSLWVDPGHRRRGVGTALLAAAERWSADDGATQVTLWLVRGNAAGETVYGAAGYRPTGATMPLVRDPSRVEERWAKVVGGPAGVGPAETE